ncbi:ATPase [Labrys miyagiensis]|uniref:ATPase n=1 Tax=Labrys miyagiensis TaxID=346912 RepID=A0ABQ6CUE0_9HYPH|nr:GAF domain-containing sensor histidine kinase [Labrys miyagiensis]GLS21861.1 ATPase [Labrys miyagiensis]
MASVSPILVDRLLAISRALAGHTNPGEAFRATAVEIGKLIPHDHMDVAVLLQEGASHACYEAGYHTSWSSLAEQPLPTSRSPVRAVLWGDMPYLLAADAVADPRFHFDGALDGPIYSAELRSRIVVPLRARGEIVGALNISRHDRDCYCLEDVDVAQQCADFIAPYIFALLQANEAQRAVLAEAEARNREELLRVGASRLTEGMERERRRMAMDLHDQTLADLARVARQISALRSQGVARAGQLADLEAEVVSCLTELRHIVDDMRPSVLELFGFRDAVEAHLNRSVSRAKPPIAVGIVDSSDGSADDLPETTRTALYRIAQEAINNAVRHADAGRIEVHIGSTSAELVVAVIDDGRGCDPPAAVASGGVGHMRTRAALIGARLEIGRASRKGGTRVEIAIDRKAGDDEAAPPRVESAEAGQ